MDPELSNLINKEISDELLKELNITTIEQYNEYIQSDKKSSKNSKKKKKEEKISKKRQKELTRKRESILNKKIKNEQRSKIIASLEKHNTAEERKIIQELSSTKNLGKKRKNSKEKNENLKENSESESSEVSLNEDEIDIEELNNLQNKKFSLGLNEENSENSEEEKSNKNFEANSNFSKRKNLMEFNEAEKSQIFNEIKQYRIKELEAENIKLAELNSTEFSSFANIDDFDIDESTLNLEIPQKENIILVNRKEEIQNERLNLPIVKYEQEIMDRINHSLFSVICGETGSGKSTQIPQFLHEYGYTNSLGNIVITQPRRVAAISLANRVSEELNCKLGEEVGYQIRYDSYHYSDKTVIKYLTDGILLREIESDSFLLKYSVVIIDEAHERTINTDIIIGLLSQAVKFRYLLNKNKVSLKGKLVKPLRLVIMSATMQVDEFLQCGIFSPKPSFIKVEARRFPVTVHHLKRTEKDYVEQAFKMTCKIHQKLPIGGILVFLTGKQEILRLCERLNDEFSGKNKGKELEEENKNEIHEEILKEENPDDIDIKENDTNEKQIPEIKNEENSENKKEEENLNEENKLAEEIANEFNEELIGEEKSKSEESFSEEEKKNDKTKDNKYTPTVIVPLFSSLTKDQQMKIFQKLESNTRLIVVSTNIAETSLTIPNVRYVVDCGKAKKRIFKAGLSFSSFQVEWISQASAEQRSGRAGRTCAGYCYRLYSNGLYCKMEKFNEPQIITSPLDQTILYLKSLDVKDINKFPFITKPKKDFVDKALRHLMLIGALDSDTKGLIKAKLAENELNKLGKSIEENEKLNDDTTITEVGRLMIKFPVIPKLARILILSNKLDLLPYGLILSSLLSMDNIFEDNYQNKFQDFNNDNNKSTEEEEVKEKNKQKKKKNLKDVLENKLISPFSDCISLMNLIIYFFISFEKNKTKSSENSKKNETEKTNEIFNFKNSKEINKLINLFCTNYNLSNKKFKEMLDLIFQLTKISTQIFNKKTKIDFSSLSIPNKDKQILLCQILLSGFIDNLARKRIIHDKLSNEKEITTHKKIIYECNENNEEVNIHPFSVVYKNNLKSTNVGTGNFCPEYLIYKEILKENKIFMNLNTVIKPEWLYDIGGDLVNFDLNISNVLNEPYYDRKNDNLFCYVNIKYGYKSWEISNVLVEMSKNDENYLRYFAKFLLEGKIFESLKVIFSSLFIIFIYRIFKDFIFTNQIFL